MRLRTRHLAFLLGISPFLRAQTLDTSPGTRVQTMSHTTSTSMPLTEEEKSKVRTYVAQLENAPQAPEAKMRRSYVLNRLINVPGFAFISCTGLEGWDPNSKDVQRADAVLMLQFTLGSYAYEVAHPDWGTHVEAAYQAGLESVLRTYPHIDSATLVNTTLDSLIKTRDAGAITKYVHDQLRRNCHVRAYPSY